MKKNKDKYVLVNVLFGFPIGKVKKSRSQFGVNIGHKTKYYATPEEMVEAWCRLGPIQQFSIRPAVLNGNEYTLLVGY